MKQDDAAGFNALHPKGFKYQGRWIKVRPMKGKGNATAAPIPQPSEASIAASASADTHEAAPKENNEIAKKAPLPDGPTDVRVDNIAYSAKKTDLRDFFKGFDVTKVVLKKGYSFVGFNSLKDAQSAATRLGGKKMLGRSVSVKVNGPPPTHG
jgi:RNA recognition motif-containing protein